MLSLSMKADRLLEDIKSRLDIVDVISDHIELKRSGQNYKGLCPFHSEKTPSFMVSPDKQIFHCFGCGTGGNIVTFVMRYENSSFSETLKILAKKAGLDLKDHKFDRNDDGLRGKLIEIHESAVKAFTKNLSASKEASAYLKKRGIKEEIIIGFSLGYAPKSWHYLSNLLKKSSFSDSLILQTGIASSGEKGIYDTFRDRIIFPICDSYGTAIAFGGRVMDDSEPKYLNSPDTPIFKKGETIYGLNLARAGIKKEGYALIVEGYFDVMSCHQYGFINAIAPLGTALTAGHLQKLKRFTKKVVLVFDGDEAGKNAAKRSLPLLLEHGFIARALLLPEKDDPDSFLRREGSKAFGSMLANAKTVTGFILDISKSKDKTETIHDAIEIIASARDMIMREELIRDLSERTDIRETVIREELKRAEKKPDKRSGKENLPPVKAIRNGRNNEELLLLSACIAFPDKCKDILQMLPAGEFRNPLVKGLFEKLRASEGSIDTIQASLNEEEKQLITGLTFDPGFDAEHVGRNIEDCVRKILLRELNKEIKDAEVSGDLNLLKALLLKRQNILKKRSSEDNNAQG